MNNNIVYILGAGCSANYGYPLAKDFRGTLRSYVSTLNQRPNCSRLKLCVTNTIDLMEQYHSPTVDRLVVSIVEEFERQRRLLGMTNMTKHSELERLEQNQILAAKIATAALFLERERDARATGLQGYRDFFNIIFEGDRSRGVLESTTRWMLSFNYDRLFEIAFSDYFRLGAGIDCYGPAWLNSGLDFMHKQAVDVPLDRFCFIKLHGSAGIVVANRDVGVRYDLNAPLGQVVDDSRFWPANGQPSHPYGNPQPLIAFPVEKDRARAGGTMFPFDNYLRAIWGEDGKPGYAENLVRHAERIWVIGYSFDPNDRKAMIDLLRESDCEILVQNRTKDGADSICEKLRQQHQDLASRLTPLGEPF